MKVCVVALALLFAAVPMEAKKMKTPKSSAAKGYKAKRNTHALKSRKVSSHSKHAHTKAN